MALAPGEPAPWFRADTPSLNQFSFSAAGGRYVLLLFAPSDPVRRQAAIDQVLALSRAPDDRHLSFMIVLASREPVQDRLPGMRWFFDPDRAVAGAYGVGEQGHWFLLDPALRIIAGASLDDTEALLARVSTLPEVNDHAATPLVAPVLIVPRVFEQPFCKTLIDHYHAIGGTPSGVMMEVDGQTVGVRDHTKSRRDVLIEDEPLKTQIRLRLQRRLLPEIEKAFRFKATRLERYLVAAYDAEEGGFFQAHRDNTTGGTAHRRFACSINLNAEAFEGGDLVFPEFGNHRYRPPTGGAVVFSCSLLHEASPVTRGTRFAFLPFFYDEAAARIRDAFLANQNDGKDS